MGKPTVHDIAREAGVSLATVDRVLNGRSGVRAVTAERVKTAITKLGYVRDLQAANLARQRQYTFEFLLPEDPGQFLRSIRDAIAEARAGLFVDKTDIRAVSLPLNDPAAMRRALSRLENAPVDGIAIMSDETPLMRDMIHRLKALDRTVVTLVTDQPNSERDHFVGIDNIAAGRTAGRLMGRFASGPGKIAIVVNSTKARDMIDRRLGLEAVLAQDYPHLRTLASLEGWSDQARTADILRRCLDQNRDIVGIYCPGGGLRGVTQVIEERCLSNQTCVICHDLTPHTRTALERGLVDVAITQDTGHLVRSAARILRAKCDGASVIASQEKIRIEIILKENLP